MTEDDFIDYANYMQYLQGKADKLASIYSHIDGLAKKDYITYLQLLIKEDHETSENK